MLSVTLVLPAAVLSTRHVSSVPLQASIRSSYVIWGSTSPEFSSALEQAKEETTIAVQANGCFQRGWYDASALMVRRLLEMLIIECFEQYNISERIKDEKSNGKYVGLDRLIDTFLNETSWYIPRNMRKYLPKLKGLKALGDSSAHDRYFTAKRNHLEQQSEAINFTIQGLVQIAKLQ